MFKKTIYKKDTKGGIRYLTISVDGDDLVQESGRIGTNKPVIHRRTVSGKNIGRSNATTSEEQAVKEAMSKYDQKLKKGYFVSQEDAETKEVILPMLASEWEVSSKHIDWSVKGATFAQPKYDGMRCLAIVKNGTVTLLSRDGVNIMEAHSDSMAHIVTDLLLHTNKDIILDGELYAHGKNFEENMQLIKKYRPGETEQIKLVVYDQKAEGMFKDRWEGIESFFDNSDGLKHIIWSEMQIINSQEELDDLHSVYLEEGYEGTIIRLAHGLYRTNARSVELIKYKDFIDIACKIVSIGPAKKRPTWARPVVEWQGKTFACSTKMSHAAREEMLKNKEDYIGKTAEVRYFEEYSSGIPRFPVMVGIRLDK